MDEKIKALSTLGAGEFGHINGSLLKHLEGTRLLLKRWSAPNVLMDAGLFHAAYGTAGFSAHLVDLEQRTRIAQVIGSEAEEIVYLYCACDRDYFWPQFGKTRKLEFKNRFTGQHYPLNKQQLAYFCELTVANELEIATDNPDFIRQYGQELFDLFSNMQPYLSIHAAYAFKSILKVN